MPTTMRTSFDVDCVVLDALQAFAGGTPPTEVRLFRKGANPSVKGTYIFDDKAAKMVWDTYTKMGRNVTWDYDHGSLRQDSQNPAQTAKSAGSCQLEIRDGELWATAIRWTKPAYDAIALGEWPFFSPAFDKDKDGRPTWLINAALTANPALFSLKELTEAASALYAARLSAAQSDAPSGDDRREAARRTAASWAANNLGTAGPMGVAPEGSPATTLPLSFRYPNSNAAGWLGCIEPTDAPEPGSNADWIAFVKPDGRTALWERRNVDGSVAGSPVLFQREIATLVPSAPDATPAEAQPMPDPNAPARGDQTGESKAGPNGETVASAPTAATPQQSAAAPPAQRRNGGAFSYGHELGAGQTGLAPGLSKVADLASHRAAVAGTPEAHAAAAQTNRDVAAAHRDLATQHTAAAAKFPDHADAHKAEADAHDKAAKRHEARAALHDEKAKAGGETLSVTLLYSPDQERDDHGRFGSGGGGGDSGKGGGGKGGSGSGASSGGGGSASDASSAADAASKAANGAEYTAQYKPGLSKKENAAQMAKAAQADHERFAANHAQAAAANKAAAAAHNDAAKAATAKGDTAAAAKHMAAAKEHEQAATQHQAFADAHKERAAQYQPVVDKTEKAAAAERAKAAKGVKTNVFDDEDRETHALFMRLNAATVQALTSLSRDASVAFLSAIPAALASTYGFSDPQPPYPANTPQPRGLPAATEAGEASPGSATTPEYFDAAVQAEQQRVAARTAKAQAAATAWAAGLAQQQPGIRYATETPPATDWQATTAPLTGRYDDPAKAGGWLGWIEPADGSWIAFVATTGRLLLWQERDANGGVVGNPVQFWRDVATLSAAAPRGTMPDAIPHALVHLSAGDTVDTDGWDYQRRNAMAIADGYVAAGDVKAGAAPDHPAATAPLTGRFADPLANGQGRWLGWIEPVTKEWIAFVALDGTTLLWTKRSDGSSEMGLRDGSGLGAPIVFKRDMTTLSAITAAAIVALSATKGGAIPFKAHPESDADWDADAAIGRLRKWASSDGSGDPDKINWSKYGSAFAYQRAPGPNGPTLGDFALPHHDVVDGKLVTVKKAVYAAAAALQGARGGVDIPAADLPAVKQHIAQHYHQWGAKAPWETTTTTAANVADSPKELSMHKALKAYCDALDIGKTALKGKIKMGVPKDMHEDAMKALSDNEQDHPGDEFVKKVVKHLKALDDRQEDAAKEVEASLAKGAATPLESAAKGEKLSIAALSALGVSLGLAADADPDQVVRTAVSNVESTRQLCNALGVKSADAIVGKVEALNARALAGDATVAKLATIEAEQVKTTALNAISEAKRAGKLDAAREAKANEFLAAGKLEVLNTYLDALSPIPALSSAPTTQLTAAQLEALKAAGQHPGSSGAGPTAAPGTSTELSIASVLKDPEFLSVAKAFGVSENPLELRRMAQEWIDDKNGVSIDDKIAKAAGITR